MNTSSILSQLEYVGFIILMVLISKQSSFFL